MARRAMTKDEKEKRQAVIDACRRMNALGINQGTSGNISVRHGEGLLITPTSTPYEAMAVDKIVFMKMDGSHAADQRPPSEWRFHLDIPRPRKDIQSRFPHPPPLFTTSSLHTRPIHPSSS